jgi:hypothetical protein
VADFVFDESCYIRGLYAETTHLAEDLAAARLLQCLQVHHRWILTEPIMSAYYRQFKKHVADNGRIASELVRSMRDVLRSIDSHRIQQRLEPIPGAYDHDDDHMVEAAAAVPGCLLITLDRKLIAALAVEGIPGRYGFEVLDVTVALARLCGEL